MDTTILGSFLRGRPRGTSQSNITTANSSPPLPPLPPPSPTPPSTTTTTTTTTATTTPVSPPTPARRRPVTGALVIQASLSNPSTAGQSVGLGISHMLRRRRSAGTISSNPPAPQPTTNPTTNAPIIPTVPPSGTGPSHRIRLVPQLDSRGSLRFDPITRDLH